MKINTTKPILEFDGKDGKLTDSLSAAVFVGEHLWLASDELTSVEQLSSGDGITFSNHKSFPLQDFIQLPAQGTKSDQEIDIEGLDYEDSYLWIVGSHSMKRKKVDKDEDATDKKIKKLAKTEIKGNRFILSRIPLAIRSETATQELVRSTQDPEDPDRLLKAGQLDCDLESNSLTNAMKQAEKGKGDLHFADFFKIPGKDNGFDIEGLAVADDRIFMGLRGPVLRGWAGILEVSVNHEDPFRLTLRDIGPEGRPYKKHFLDLKGLGIRDLCIHGRDMLILAGPTMNLDGPVVVYKWPNALESTNEELIFSDQLRQLFVVPNGLGNDHAEGMALISDGERPQVLIVYDSPSKERRVSARAIRADVFDLPVTFEV